MPIDMGAPASLFPLFPALYNYNKLRLINNHHFVPVVAESLCLNLKRSTIMISVPILQIGKWRHREVK